MTNNYRKLTVIVVSILGCILILSLNLELMSLKILSTIVTLWILVALPKKTVIPQKINYILIQKGLLLNKSIKEMFNEAFIPMFASIPSAFLLTRIFFDRFPLGNCFYIFVNILLISLYLLFYTRSFMPNSLKHKC